MLPVQHMDPHNDQQGGSSADNCSLCEINDVTVGKPQNELTGVATIVQGKAANTSSEEAQILAEFHK